MSSACSGSISTDSHPDFSHLQHPVINFSMEKTTHYSFYSLIGCRVMNEKKINKSPSVLVTGSTGFLGSRIVKKLISNGFKVRAFVLKTSNINKLRNLDVEICVGNIADLALLRPAFEDIDYVVHAAADTVGSVEGGRVNTIQGTKNVLALCKEFNAKKLIYISSCSVYGVTDYQKGYVVTEESSLERAPETRGAYSNAKFQAEKVVLQTMSENAYPIVCLRPGTIYGPGGEIYTPMMGFSFGSKIFLTIGDGKFVLPLVYIDNVADAVRIVLEKAESGGKVYNLIDPYQLTKKQYIERLMKKVYPQAKFLYFPYSILYIIVYFQEVLFKLIDRTPFLTRYRLESSQKKIVYDGDKIRRELNWTPPVSLDDALNNILEYEMQRQN